MSKIFVYGQEFSVEQIEELIDEIKQNKEDYNELENDFEELKYDLGRMTERKEAQEVRCTAYCKEIKEMTRKMDKCKLLKEKGLVDQCDNYKQKSDMYFEKSCALEDQLKKLKESSQSNNSDDDKDNIIRTMKEEIAELKNNDHKDNIIRTKKEEIGELKAEIKEYKKKIGKDIIEEDNKIIKASYDDLKINYQVLEKEIAQIKTSNKKVLEKRNKEIKILEASYDDLKINYQVLEKVLEKRNKEIKILEEKLKNKTEIKTQTETQTQETQTEERNNLPEKETEIKTPKLETAEFTKEDIFKVFDMIYENKMSKKTNPKVASRLMNKRKNVIDIIVNDKKKIDDKEDYSVDFMKTIITLIKDNNKKEERINKLIDKM